MMEEKFGTSFNQLSVSKRLYYTDDSIERIYYDKST